MSYGETKYESVNAVVVQANFMFFVCKASKVQCSLLLLNRANGKVILHAFLELGSSLCGLVSLFLLLYTTAKGGSIREDDESNG